ncbi:MAG: hypothetical protein II058_05750, partial [Rhodocyclaceae bacterium]|nr:hypothetical protein [Rhodocyclaceae bacterium]
DEPSTRERETTALGSGVIVRRSGDTVYVLTNNHVAGSATKISSEVIRPEPLEAPVQKGQTIATLRVKLGERTLLEQPLQALETVERSGWFGRAWDAIRLLWN